MLYFIEEWNADMQELGLDTLVVKESIEDITKGEDIF